MPDRVPIPPLPDPMAKWTPPPDWTTAALAREGWSARPVLGLDQVVIAGNLAAGLAAFAPSAAGLGLWQVAEADPPGQAIVVRMARDKALLVSPRALGWRAGWRQEGFALSRAESLYLIIDIEGGVMPEVVREAVTADLMAGSPSAATLFAGVPVLLYRSAPEIARVHVETGFAPYLWRWLETRK